MKLLCRKSFTGVALIDKAEPLKQTVLNIITSMRWIAEYSHFIDVGLTFDLSQISNVTSDLARSQDRVRRQQLTDTAARSSPAGSTNADRGRVETADARAVDATLWR